MDRFLVGLGAATAFPEHDDGQQEKHRPNQAVGVQNVVIHTAN